MTLPLAYAPMYGSRGENRTLKLTRLKRAHMPIFWYSAKFMVLATGFEPASSRLKAWHSTLNYANMFVLVGPRRIELRFFG